MRILKLAICATCLLAFSTLPLKAQYQGLQLPGFTGLQAGTQPQLPGYYVVMPLFYDYHDISIYGAQGNNVLKDATVGINVITLPTFAVVTPFNILGGNYGASFTEYIANGRVDVAAQNFKRSSSYSYGDIYVQPATLGWHLKRADVTNEMLAAMDWLPTLAGMVGASNLVPKDRPIDGVDASAFMLGKSNTTGRDSYMFFGPDGELMSVKWKIYKTILRYSEGLDEPIVKPQFPMTYDLSSHPHEDWNLFSTKLTNGWMFAPVFRLILQYEASVKKYPNIKPGEEFKGY